MNLLILSVSCHMTSKIYSPPLTGCTEVSGDGYDDGYLLFKTDSAECEYSLDMPGDYI